MYSFLFPCILLESVTYSFCNTSTASSQGTHILLSLSSFYLTEGKLGSSFPSKRNKCVLCLQQVKDAGVYGNSHVIYRLNYHCIATNNITQASKEIAKLI